MSSPNVWDEKCGAIPKERGEVLDGGKCLAKGTRGLNQVQVLVAGKWKPDEFISQMSCRCMT